MNSRENEVLTPILDTRSTVEETRKMGRAIDNRSTSEDKMKNALRVKSVFVREFLAEFLGTFALVLFVCSSSAMSVLNPKLNTPLSCAIAGGFGVAMGVYLSGGVSGGHINPAVSLAFAVIGRLPFKKLPFYWLGQYLGGFTAAFIVFCIYRDAINNVDGGQHLVTGVNATAQIWSTYPMSYVSNTSAFFDQIFGSMLLMLGVLALTDEKNMAPSKGFLPIAIGILMSAIGVSFTANCGGPLNPARDLSPRIFTTMAGWGRECFTAHNYYFWIPIIGPHVGTIFGAWIYLVLVGIHI